MDPQGKHIAIKCQNLWKIFGKEPERILDATRQEGSRGVIFTGLVDPGIQALPLFLLL